MKDIKSLIERLDYQILSNAAQGEITQLVYDSRKLVKGCMFVAIKGEFFDGHSVVSDAVNAGAKAIVVCDDVPSVPEDVVLIKVDDTRRALALISAAYFDYPADKIKVIGVTGTKGKTTTTYCIKTILEKTGKSCGLIGTIETIIGDEHIPSENTTPESYLIWESLKKMLDKGIEYCVMEASSQGFLLHRTAGLEFFAGLITNLSPDHIGPNEHKDFEDYKNCKKMLFSQSKDAFFNADDKYFHDFYDDCTVATHTYGIENDADLRASDIELINDGNILGISFRVNGFDERLCFPLPGYFSVYNALSAIAIARHIGIDFRDIQKALMEVKVKGRIESVEMPGDYTLLIDYSHNAVALSSILNTLRVYEPGRLISIFGCGGNRDKNRRFEMGDVSGRLADFTIITSDNPRFEEPLDIMRDIESSIVKTGGEYIMIEERKEAIRYAVKHAKSGDIILLAGKGHEDYQVIGDVKYPMDERQITMEVLQEEGLI